MAASSSSAAVAPTVKLNSGYELPVVGFGTWKAGLGETEASVYTALCSGYRHIDCARLYGNEKEVGNGIARAIKDGVVKREEIFVTSKVWNDSHTKELTRKSVSDMLSDLQLTYLDLVLIHWPVSNAVPDRKDEKGNTVLETDPSKAGIRLAWEALEGLVDEKKVRSIGVSNFSPAQIEEMKKYARIQPAVNQIEVQPYFPQNENIEYAKKNGIVIVAYSPLGNLKRVGSEDNTPLNEKVIETLAAKYHKSPAQIILRWGVQHGQVVLPKSVTPERIRSNIQIFDFQLTKEDMEQIAELGKKNYRFVNPTFGGKPVFP